MRLLVTRPEPDAEAQAARLRELGHDPTVEPLLIFQNTAFDPALLASCDALIITSGNSLRALREGGDIAAASRLPLYCVGEKTSRRARDAGFETIAATAETAQELARRIGALASSSAKLLHITGEHRAFDLGGALAQHGFAIQTAPVYGMRARESFSPGVAEQLRAGLLDGVILMSPRTAEIFLTLCERDDLSGHAKQLRYFCLAQSVAEKLRLWGASLVSIAAKPSHAELLALVAD